MDTTLEFMSKDAIVHEANISRAKEVVPVVMGKHFLKAVSI